VGDDPPIRHPGLPSSGSERAVEELVEAPSLLPAQERLRSLVSAIRAVGEELDLPVVLHRITQAAVDLVGARYGALGVVGRDGELEQFILVGLDAKTAERIDHLPHGRGVRGAATSDPIRLDHLGQDLRAAGFPPQHTATESVAGVPIGVRGEVFGNLYLTNEDGRPFTAEDEELLTSLAVSAGVAIHNARLYGETRRRHRWAAASAEISSRLLREEGPDPLHLIASTLAELTEADSVALVVRSSSTSLIVEDAWGTDADAFRGRVFGVDGTVSGQVISSASPTLSPAIPNPTPSHEDDVTGPAMFLPLTAGSGPYGVLVVIRPPGSPHFTEADLYLAMDFAAHTSVALKLREARAAHDRMTLLEDRSRIARDLHDHVIQRLFGAGLGLHSIDRESLPPVVSRKLDLFGEAIDEAISGIRKSVFALETADTGPSIARRRLVDVVNDAGPNFLTPPRLILEGGVDEWVPDDMVDDLEAVVREGLANAARHAHAKTVSVQVAADETAIAVLVVDDGPGVGNAGPASGTANLRARAEGWGGTSVLRDGENGGTVLEWRVPTPQRRGAA
jgi:signal transduction histidine kinase